MPAFAMPLLREKPRGFDFPPVLVPSDEHMRIMDARPSAAAAASFFLERIERDYVRPLLRCQAQPQILQFLETNWSGFASALDGFAQVLRLEKSDEQAPSVEAAAHLRSSAVSLAGEEGGESVDFAVHVYVSALHLRSALDPDCPVSPGDEARDRELSLRFSFYARLHMLGAMAINLAVGDRAATPFAREAAFDMLRLGALESYAAVREALEMRAAKPEITAADDSIDAHAWAEADLRDQGE